MTSYDAHVRDAKSVEGLLRLVPDPDRAERVRGRCRTQLARRGRPAARTAVSHGFAWRVLAPAVVGGFGVLYAVALVATTLRLQSLFR